VRELLVGEVEQGRTSPDRERGPKRFLCPRGLTGGERLTALGEQTLEAGDIELLRLDRKQVATSTGQELLASDRQSLSAVQPGFKPRATALAHRLARAEAGAEGGIS
jgi:hypothetical protein